MNADGNPVSDQPIDEPRRGTRLYPFPGGMIERWDGTDDDTDPGVYVQFFDLE